MKSDSRFKKWDKWLSVIHTDVQGLLINRHILREVQRIIRSNRKIQQPTAFYEWMRNIYNASVVMGIRRQLDSNKKSISFVRLFEEILRNPETLSRERYAALYVGSGLPDSFVNRAFDKFSGAGRPHVAPARVRANSSTLSKKGERIRKFANKRVAHFDRSRFKDLPTETEIDNALDYLERLLKKYLALFRAEVYHRIVPTWTYDWKEVFRHPWIESSRQR